MKQVYYAHCLAIYDTPQETRDIDTLLDMGFCVFNPNAKNVQEIVEQMKKDNPNADYMSFFYGLVQEADAFAFRALPDGSIPAGVAKELAWARHMKKPVIELPSCELRRTLSLDLTREYLKEVGQR